LEITTWERPRQRGEQDAVSLNQGASENVVAAVARSVLKIVLRRLWTAAQQRKCAFTWQPRAAEPEALWHRALQIARGCVTPCQNLVECLQSERRLQPTIRDRHDRLEGLLI
jgi:hypothetical protein